MGSVYERTIPGSLVISSITAPVTGSKATITSLLNAAQIALIGSEKILQVEVQDQSGLGLRVYAPGAVAGAGSWKIAADGSQAFPGLPLTAQIESQTAATAACAVVISFASGGW